MGQTHQVETYRPQEDPYDVAVENALAVLDEAIKNHGKPASIITDHGSQFYANAQEAKRKGALVREEAGRAEHQAHSGSGGTHADQRQAGAAARGGTAQTSRV